MKKGISRNYKLICSPDVRMSRRGSREDLRSYDQAYEMVDGGRMDQVTQMECSITLCKSSNFCTLGGRQL